MAYKQRWLAYFEVLDANSDGAIDQLDVEGIVAIAQKTGTTPEVLHQIRAAATDSIANLIKEFDSNRDGKINREEWLSGVEKSFIGKTIETAPAWWKDVVARTFNAVDINKNGEIAEEEYVKEVSRMSPATSPDAVRAAYHKFKGPGKFDVEAFKRLMFVWASSPNPEPEAEALTPIFRKQH